MTVRSPGACIIRGRIEPVEKARRKKAPGAYGVQNGAAKFVAGIEGCYFNVMGFPVSRVYNALKELDVL